MELKRNEPAFTNDASLLGELQGVPPSEIHGLMRRQEITSLCERGEGEHEGQFRLTFFYRGRRARLSVDEAGRVVRRSVIELGERPAASSRSARTARRPG